METPASPEEQFAQVRMREMHELIELLTNWAEDVKHLPDADLKNLLFLGSKVSKLLSVKNQLTVIGGGKKPAKRSPVSEE